MLPDRTADRREHLEDALIQVRSDMLLMSLAVDLVESAATAAKEAGWQKSGVLRLPLRDEDVSALAHARLNLHASVRELNKAFYGEETPV